MCLRFPFLVFLFVIFFFIFKSDVLALTVTAGSLDPQQLYDTEERTITVQVEASSTAGAGYIKAVFFKKDTTNYFGCTKSSASDYYCGSTNSSYPVLNGSGSIQITLKVDSSSTSKYAGEGEYQFKVFRCTSSACNDASEVQTVHITRNPTPSVSPTPTPMPPKVSLSEVMPCPGAGDKEWIEIHNKGSDIVNLEGWELRDEVNNKHTLSGEIKSGEYQVIELNKSMYDHGAQGDTVLLFASGQVPIESFEYDFNNITCEPDVTYAKTTSWQLTTNVTKGKANSIATPRPSSSPTPSVKPSATPTSSPTPSPSVSPSPTASASGEVLGISEEEASVSALQLRDISDEDQPEHAGSVVRRIPPQALYLAYLSIGIGITCLTCAGVLFYRDWYNRKKKRKRKK